MVRSELAYYVLRTLNRTAPAYCTAVQFLKRTVPTYRTCTITKKAFRTSLPYFLAKIQADRTALTYYTVLPFQLLFNYSQFELTLKSLVYKSAISIHTYGVGFSCLNLCIQKFGAMCKKSGILNSNSVPTYRTRTITKKAYRTSSPYFLAKIQAYSTVPTYRTVLLSELFRDLVRRKSGLC